METFLFFQVSNMLDEAEPAPADDEVEPAPVTTSVVWKREWSGKGASDIIHGNLIATHDTEYVLHLLKALQLAKTDAELRKLTGGGSFSCLTSSTA